jgi:long-subunit acyl-CoA synthetase (AMP-forming)
MGINEEGENLLNNKEINEYVLNTLIEHGKKEGLFGFELAKKIRLWPVSFRTLGIFTSTLKLQRHVAKKAFAKEIQEMYK